MNLSDIELLQQNIALLTPAERAELEAALTTLNRGCRTNRYIDAICPELHDKQIQFLSLDCLEAMFGGAAGGGKSQSLLLAALQYVDIPGYSAGLFRRTFTDLSGEGSIMNRAQQWMQKFPDVRWSAEQKSFFFPEGSRLSFGYLQDPDDHLRYQGWEWQFIGIDEVTQHREMQYRYLFSRLRRLKGVDIPIRMRSATNPGGPGGEWVKDRFIPDDFLTAETESQFSHVWGKREDCEDCEATGTLNGEPCFYCDGQGHVERIFVPSRIADNPSLDQRQYAKSLALLPPLERMRLQSGRWDVMETGDLFKQAWFRYYTNVGSHLRMVVGDGSNRLAEHGTRVRFITADTASKEKTTSDPTVICVWDMTQAYDLCLVHAIRERMEVPRIAPLILSESARWGVEFVLIEDAASGIGVIQTLRGPAGNGLAVKNYSPHGRDKVARSTIAQIRMEAGQVYFPANEAPWLSECLTELLAFPVGSNDDFVDNLSMAAWWVSTQHRGESGGKPPERVRAGLTEPSGMPFVSGGMIY